MHMALGYRLKAICDSPVHRKSISFMALPARALSAGSIRKPVKIKKLSPLSLIHV